MTIQRICLEFMPGTIIDNAIREAIELAKRYRCVVSFNFNEVIMEVRDTDTFEEVHDRWKESSGIKVWEYQLVGLKKEVIRK